MKLQDMPILDRMYPGATYQTLSDKGGENHKVTPSLFRNIAGFKRFKLDNGFRVPSPEGMVDAEKVFGHLMLPFPKVWIEWDNRRNHTEGNPPLWVAAACVSRSEVDNFMADLLGEEGNISPEQGSTKTISSHMLPGSWAMFMFEVGSGVPRLFPFFLLIQLDDEGMLQGFGSGRLTGSPENVASTDLIDLGWDSLAAIGLLNCQNITTHEHDRSKNVKRRPRPNRDKAGTLNFNTINLPGTGGAGGSGDKTETMARHMARGHFKTFTDEAPLFGKYTGTYWWGWQVRGSRKNGEVVSDYKIKKDVAK